MFHRIILKQMEYKHTAYLPTSQQWNANWLLCNICQILAMKLTLKRNQMQNKEMDVVDVKVLEIMGPFHQQVSLDISIWSQHNDLSKLCYSWQSKLCFASFILVLLVHLTSDLIKFINILQKWLLLQNKC